jgi:hypothetical protein
VGVGDIRRGGAVDLVLLRTFSGSGEADRQPIGVVVGPEAAVALVPGRPPRRRRRQAALNDLRCSLGLRRSAAAHRPVEATVAELRGKGVRFEDYDLPGLKTVNGIAELGGIRGAWFKDPEGNILSVVQLRTA